MNVTYSIVLHDNTGSFAADALASLVNGNWYNSVQRYDGEHDLVFIDVPEEEAEHFEDVLDNDDNVVKYSV